MHKLNYHSKSIFFLLFLSFVLCCSPTKPPIKESKIPLSEEYVTLKVEFIENEPLTDTTNNEEILNSRNKNDSTNNLVQDLYTNPFCPSTTINWIVEKPDSFRISLVDMNGNTISTLCNQFFSKGSYRITLQDIHVNSGVYFIVSENDTGKWKKKIILIK